MIKKIWAAFLNWWRCFRLRSGPQVPVVPVKDPEQASQAELKKGWTRLMYKLWKYRHEPIRTTANYCLICGKGLRRAPGQIVYYCSRECRHMRHNRARHA